MLQVRARNTFPGGSRLHEISGMPDVGPRISDSVIYCISYMHAPHQASEADEASGVAVALPGHSR